MFAKSYDPLSEKFYPILVSPKGFVKVYVPKLGKYMSSAGFLSKKSKYYRVSVLQKNGKRKYYYVHRLVAETFCERPAQILKFVHHLNHNTCDNRAENLEWTSVGLNCLMKKTLCYMKAYNMTTKSTSNHVSTGKETKSCQLKFLKPLRKLGNPVLKFANTFTMRRELGLSTQKKREREKHLVSSLTKNSLKRFIPEIQKLIVIYSGHLCQTGKNSLAFFVFF